MIYDVSLLTAIAERCSFFVIIGYGITNEYDCIKQRSILENEV